MTGFVKLILEASFTAGLAALAVILIRLAMKKAPKRWAYALWAVVFFRCLCPFSAESAVSLFNVIPERTPEVPETSETSAIVSEINNRPAVMEQVETDLQSYGYTPYPVPVSIEPVKEAPEPAKKPVNKSFIFFAVWAAGTLAMTLYGVISYILLMRKLKTAVKTEDGVYESDLISTAFSAGFFPPKIYVPCGLFEEERKLIIAHERVHIRRLDYIVKPVAFLGLAVHWFNPVIWLAFALMTRDMELSCDEAVLKIFGAGEKKAYSEALLHVSMKRSGLVDNYKFMPLAFAETGIKGRVRNVLKYKKPTLIVTVLAAAVVIAACAVLGTNAKSKADDIPKEIEYIKYRQGVTNNLTDVNGNKINLLVDRINSPKNSGIYYSRALVEGEIALNSVTVTDADGSLIESKSTVSFGDSSVKRLIMAVDMTEFKINSLEVFEEDGKNFLKAQFEFTLAEDAALPMRDGLIRLGGDEEPRMLITE
ncbi:MAG: M56 family metallopeptidase, partial [Oscillospiraceae bacterium]|nr:M56 family metallopeptidase [Oscillospiraceae bacterium]